MYATLYGAMVKDIANAPEDIKTAVKKFNKLCEISPEDTDFSTERFAKALYESEDHGLIWLLGLHVGNDKVQQAMYKYLHGLRDMLPTLNTSDHIEFMIRLYSDLGYKYSRIVKYKHKEEIDLILLNAAKILFDTKSYDIRGLAYEAAEVLNKTFKDTSMYEDIQKMVYTFNELADKYILNKPMICFCPPKLTAYHMIMGSARINAMLVEAREEAK